MGNPAQPVPDLTKLRRAISTLREDTTFSSVAEIVDSLSYAVCRVGNTPMYTAVAYTARGERIAVINHERPVGDQADEESVTQYLNGRLRDQAIWYFTRELMCQGLEEMAQHYTQPHRGLGQAVGKVMSTVGAGGGVSAPAGAGGGGVSAPVHWVGSNPKP